MAFTKLDHIDPKTAIAAQAATGESLVSRHGMAGAILAIGMALSGALFGVAWMWIDAEDGWRAQDRLEKSLKTMKPAVNDEGGAWALSVPVQTGIDAARIGTWWYVNLPAGQVQGWDMRAVPEPVDGLWSWTTPLPDVPSGTVVSMRLVIEASDGSDYWGARVSRSRP